MPSDHAKTVVKVHFAGFWPQFDPEVFFLPLMRSVRNDLHFEALRVSRGADIRIQAGLKPPGRLHLTRKVSEVPSIWYTGENLRPPLSGYSTSLSFDADSDTFSNCYLPLWWLYLPEWAAKQGVKRLVHRMLSPRALPSTNPKFACAVLGNPEPVRMKMIQALREVGPVDVLGRLTARPVKDKHSVVSQYRYNICLENDIYPGYVTEKPFEAWLAGAVPIWQGIDRYEYVNQKALLNLANYVSPDDLVAHVADLEESAIAYREIQSQPILNRAPDFSCVRRAILTVLSGI